MIIKILSETFQKEGTIAAYHLRKKYIALGCAEGDVTQAIFHEVVHKVLQEEESEKSCFAWDNINCSVERHLFGRILTKPYL